MQTIYWHDYETFGADPQRDRPCQFAGVRTDLDLNIIEEPLTIYCSPSEDFLPSPKACLVTKITPQVAKQNGVSEAEFAITINEIFSVPGTCVAGYNSIRFDDEVTRNLLYRNFIDPYEREWRNANSRWDLIDVVRLVHVMRPDALIWPKDDQGNTSFRLERLTEANGISHEAAHDAMSDVYATIELAKLIKQREPRLFEWAFDFRNKEKVGRVFDMETLKPLLHVSSKYRAAQGCCAIVAPVFRHPVNKNGVVVWDLRKDPSVWFKADTDLIRASLYSPAENLPEGADRPALKTVHINKCPILLPAASLKQLSEPTRKAWDLDEVVIKENLNRIRDNRQLIESWSKVFEDERKKEAVSDPDLMIYSGGFFPPEDKREMSRIRSVPISQLNDLDFHFRDSRLHEMLFRYRARNSAFSLTAEEQEEWMKHCRRRLVDGEGGFLNLRQFGAELESLWNSQELTQEERFILEELQCYAESIVPFS